MSDSMENSGASILIADDDEDFCRVFGQMLTMKGYRVDSVSAVGDIVKMLNNKQYDLLTLDLDWENEDISGLNIYSQVREIDPFLPVLIITGHASIPTAVEATRMGAFDYIEKMTAREKTLLIIKNAIETGRLKRLNNAFLNEIRAKHLFVGESKPIIDLLEKVQKVAPTDSTVLISGESGTGKELIARQLHYHSKRGHNSFVPVDSGTLSDNLAESELFGHRRGAFTGAVADRKGLFEEAEGGTLFFDEISNASMSVQAKLLHVLQEREYRPVGMNNMRACNVRIISATNRDLNDLVKNGQFRDDLFYRLKVIDINIPPVRERKEDIPLLADHFMKLKSRQHSGSPKSLTPDAVNLLLDYDWPGNVRELENTIERIVILGSEDKISAEDVKGILGSIWLDKDSSLKSLSEMTHAFRRECIIKAISLADGRIAKAAEILEVDRTHLYKLINEYDLKNKQ